MINNNYVLYLYIIMFCTIHETLEIVNTNKNIYYQSIQINLNEC